MYCTISQSTVGGHNRVVLELNKWHPHTWEHRLYETCIDFASLIFTGPLTRQLIESFPGFNIVFCGLCESEYEQMEENNSEDNYLKVADVDSGLVDQFKLKLIDNEICP